VPSRCLRLLTNALLARSNCTYEAACRCAARPVGSIIGLFFSSNTRAVATARRPPAAKMFYHLYRIVPVPP
jgi:hypothetical protein